MLMGDQNCHDTATTFAVQFSAVENRMHRPLTSKLIMSAVLKQIRCIALEPTAYNLLSLVD